ncbi:MAG: hypothetical protein JNM90_19120 [Burkholderiales bacterium]|nr:hypothetical protein [Burkholderiales bacterium]
MTVAGGPALGVGQALAALPPAAWMREVSWAYPAVETLHIIAIAALVGTVLLVDLRVLGVSRLLPATALMRHALPLTWIAFAAAAATGVLLFLAHAADLIGNRVFVVKMCLIGAAGANAAAFHGGAWGRAHLWEVGRAAPAPARLFAGLSIALWVAVIACGRWIAYA